MQLKLSTLPASRMKYPDSFAHQLKYIFWRLYTPLHPFCRDTLISFGILKHEGRQEFLVGKLAEGQTVESVVGFLVGKGYGNHFIAWRDQGELVGLRYVENFVYQYHIRIFEDGEVRAHYEYTPECHPILHMRKVAQKDRRQEFIDLLGDRLIAASPAILNE